MTQNLSQKFSGLTNVLTFGISAGVCLAIGIFLGLQIDNYFSTKPWGIMAGILIGLLAMVRQFWLMISEGLKSHEKNRNKISK